MKIIECPRDAMQGIRHFIPTHKKAEYLNALLKVGFHTLDFGSFVSASAVPQMKDTGQVLSMLNLENTDTQLLAIVANLKGAEIATQYPEIQCIGYPFSISETFQIRNTTHNLEQAWNTAQKIYELCQAQQKELVVYLSMCFGNPYNDMWHPAIVEHWADRFVSLGVKTISLADTVGVATPQSIGDMFANMHYCFPHIEFGAHLHTEPSTWQPKIEAAYQNGCRRFDGALKGYGGCPFAQNTLVGNMPTEFLIQYATNQRADFFIDNQAFNTALQMANSVFLESSATH